MEPMPEAPIARPGSAWIARLGGLAVGAYLVVLLNGFGLLRLVLPRACWLTRLDRRWTDLWMR